MKHKRKNTIFLTGVILVLITSCMPARRLPEDHYLLNRNRIVVEDAEINRHELRSYLRQTPNRRILGLYRLQLNVYQLADRGDDSRFRDWLKYTIGEPPVIFDPLLASLSSRQFELFLQNKGYFNAEVDYDVNIRRSRANVTYNVKGNEAYRIRQINYNIRDPHLAYFVYSDTLASLLAEGDRYDTDLLQQERQRITRNLKDQGFFRFSRDHIFFQVDSTLNRNMVDLDVIIENPRTRGNSANNNDVRHRRYRLNNIDIYPEYSRMSPARTFADTTIYHDNGDSLAAFTFYHNGPMRIRPRTIVNNILLKPGDFYSLSMHEQSQHYLSGLRNFRFINIQFREAEINSINPKEGADTLGWLNVRTELTPSPSNAFTLEAEGLNTAGNLGVAGNFLFQNRNLFRGAERLNIRFKGALEVSGGDSDQEVFQRLPFNTLELGTDISVDVPKLLTPISFERLSLTSRPQTTVQTGINYRQRPDYTRYILNFSYGFQWTPDMRRQHQFTPLEISSIKIFNDSILQSRIPDANPLILSRYKDHLIGGMKYRYTHTTQYIDRQTDFFYFRSNLETSGNLMYLAAQQFNMSRNEEGSYTIREIPFAQYIKADADLRIYRRARDNNTLVFRLMGGIGVPFGNIDVMPFIKSYYGGGANSVRAWNIYNLGPGGYRATDALRFDKYGDIKIEANAEYRFPAYRFIHGALFIDAGNVWFLEKNEQFPLGEFDPGRFYREIAIGAGAGIRLDFDFFLVRLDAAFPVRNPAMHPKERWMSDFPGFGRWNFNLGIGYPF